MATTELAEALPPESVRLILAHGQEFGLGTALDLRRALWEVEVAQSVLDPGPLNVIQAIIEGLDGGLGSFLLWNPARPYPQADPTGAIVGASAVKVRAIGDDGHSFSLKGLPAFYTLQRGDMVQVTSGSPARQGLHRITDTVPAIADGSGNTDLFEVRPAIHPVTAVNDVVNLKRSAGEFRIVPGSYDPGAARASGRIAFRARQRIG